MADGNGVDVEGVQQIYVRQGIATSVATDGSLAMLAFQTTDGGIVHVILPVEGIAQLRAMANDLAVTARQRQVGTGNIAPRCPKVFTVGHSDQMRGMVAIIWEPETPEEAVYMITDAMGLNLATAVRDNVLGRMTPAERARATAGLSVPAPSRIIMPPGR
jgi:hypothetical protein